MKPLRFTGSVWQNGVQVAAVDAPDEESLERELAHYAMMYGQDGPVEIRRCGERRQK